MTEQTLTNENWVACETCGESRLVYPATGVVEPCANCASRSRKMPLAAGTTILLLMIGAIVALVALGIVLLF